MNMLIRNRLGELPVFSNTCSEFFNDIDKITANLFGAGKSGGFYPSFALEESKNAYKVTAELPGMELEDVEVTLNENVVTIIGEKKSEKEEKDSKYHILERRYGKFERSFSLGDDVNLEKVKGVIKNGVLTVTIGKTKKAEKTTKKIAITGE